VLAGCATRNGGPCASTVSEFEWSVMPAAIIPTMPANAPVADLPVSAAALPAPVKPASGSPVFAQMMAQKMATLDPQPSCTKSADKSLNSASSIASANPPANVPQKKAATAGTTSSASTQGIALFNQLSPVLGPILPPSIGVPTNNSASAIPASIPCSAWTITEGAGSPALPDSTAPPDTSNSPTANAASREPPSGSTTSIPANQIASGAGNSSAPSTVNTDPIAIASSPETEMATESLPTAVTTSLAAQIAAQPAAQYATLDQTGDMAPNPRLNPNPVPPLGPINSASTPASVVTPLAVPAAAASQTRAVAFDANAPALQNQAVPPGSKTPAATPVTASGKVSAIPSSSTGIASIHPQLPTLGDVLRQVAAVTEKTNATAAAMNARIAKDPLSAPVKSPAVSSLDMPKTDLQSNVLRSSVVGSHQNAVDQVNVQKSGGGGTGNTADDQEPTNSTLTAPDAKENSTGAIANFNDKLNAAQQNTPDPSCNLQSGGAAPATIQIAKDASQAQTTSSSDPSRSDSSNSAAPDKPDLGAGTSGPINNAQLAGTGAHSEMHIAMQTDKLGAVELHARVTGEQVGAAIMVEKREAHAALAVELPSLQQALSEKSLQVQSVVLLQGAVHSTAHGAGDHAQHQPRSQPGTVYRQSQEIATLPPVFAAAAEPSGIFDDRGRLSVLA